MQEDPTSAEQLIDKAEAYGKTTLELIRLKSIDKTADVLSYLAGYFILFIFMAVFAMLLNIGIALWIGELSRKKLIWIIKSSKKLGKNTRKQVF